MEGVKWSLYMYHPPSIGSEFHSQFLWLQFKVRIHKPTGLLHAKISELLNVINTHWFLWGWYESWAPNISEEAKKTCVKSPCFFLISIPMLFFDQGIIHWQLSLFLALFNFNTYAVLWSGNYYIGNCHCLWQIYCIDLKLSNHVTNFSLYKSQLKEYYWNNNNYYHFVILGV